MTVYLLESLVWPNDKFLGIFSTLELAKSQVATGGIPWVEEGHGWTVTIPGGWEKATFTIDPFEVDKRY